MKKILSAVVAVCIVFLVSCGGGAASETDNKLSVGVIISDKSDSSLDMESGLFEGLGLAGITRENADIVCKYAGFEGYPLQDICISMADGGYDAVVCIGTVASEAFVALGSDVPCFVCGVSTVYDIGLTEMSDPYVTGVLDSFPAEETVAMVNALTPDVDKFGLLYTTGEGADVVTVNDFCQYLDSVQIDYTLRTAEGSKDVIEVAEALIADGAEAIFVPSDKIVYGEMNALSTFCGERGIPVYSSEAAAVKLGALAAVSSSDREMGHQTAELVSRYLGGESVENMPFAFGNTDFCAFNESTAERLSVVYPESFGYKTVKYS